MAHYLIGFTERRFGCGTFVEYVEICEEKIGGYAQSAFEKALDCYFEEEIKDPLPTNPLTIEELSLLKKEHIVNQGERLRFPKENKSCFKLDERMNMPCPNADLLYIKLTEDQLKRLKPLMNTSAIQGVTYHADKQKWEKIRLEQIISLMDREQDL
ncbi:hypothetical protein HY643_00885 [Candidatus Woesearchaeota archaeon]|nr:hypothetical protein [Candidatus Woesearchaeota archaeon]